MRDSIGCKCGTAHTAFKQIKIENSKNTIFMNIIEKGGFAFAEEEEHSSLAKAYAKQKKQAKEAEQIKQQAMKEQFEGKGKEKEIKINIKRQQHVVEMLAGGRVIINNSLVAEQTFLQQNITSKTKDAINNLKTKFNIILIPLSIFTGILTFILAFPNTILENVILKKIDVIIIFINSDIFIWLWFSLFTINIIVWCISFFSKEKMKKKLSELTLESKQNELFNSFINSGNHNLFSKDNFTKYISRQLKGIGIFKKIINKFLISIVTIMDISQDISNLIINKAITKEIIVVVNNNCLFDLYLVKEWRQMSASLPPPSVQHKTKNKFMLLKLIKRKK